MNPANQSKDPEGQAGSDATGDGSAPAKSWGHMIGLWLRDLLLKFVSIAIVSVILAALWQYFSPHQESALRFQQQLYESARSINALALVDYILGDFAGYFFAPIRSGMDAISGALAGLIEWLETTFQLPPPVRPLLILIASPVVLIVGMLGLVIAFIVMGLSVVLSPIILPVAVLTKGSLLDAIMVLFIFLPTLWLLIRIATVSTEGEDIRARLAMLWLSPFVALLATTVFYFFVQLAMLGALWAFGKLVPLAPTGIAASAIAAFGFQCAAKTVESSITEQVANFLRRLAGSFIHSG